MHACDCDRLVNTVLLVSVLHGIFLQVDIIFRSTTPIQWAHASTLLGKNTHPSFFIIAFILWYFAVDFESCSCVSGVLHCSVYWKTIRDTLKQGTIFFLLYLCTDIVFLYLNICIIHVL